MNHSGTEATKRHWLIVDFGKHRGSTLPEIMLNDPGYILWALENNVLDDRPELKAQAEEVCDKARRIRVPNSDTGEQSAEYVLAARKHFCRLDLIPKGQPGRSIGKTIVKEVIDLTLARSLAPFDKYSTGRLTAAFKRLFFGDPSRPLSADQCARFFENENNFA